MDKNSVGANTGVHVLGERLHRLWVGNVGLRARGCAWLRLRSMSVSLGSNRVEWFECEEIGRLG